MRIARKSAAESPREEERYTLHFLERRMLKESDKTSLQSWEYLNRTSSAAQLEG